VGCLSLIPLLLEAARRILRFPAFVKGESQGISISFSD
jgi:hypothetical protein